MRRMSRRRKSTLFSAVIVAIAALCTYFFMGGPELSDQKTEPQTGGRAGGFYPRAGEGARAANSILRCWASRRDADSPAQRADYAH